MKTRHNYFDLELTQDRTDIELMSDKLAWQNALSLRACPPDNILFGEKTPMLEKHLRGCNLCQENLCYQDEPAEWQWPALRVDSQTSPGLETDLETDVEAGQVRRIRPGRVSWGPKNRYYNPPLVLLLERVGKQDVSVAQLYAGDDFMGPQDISIEGLGYVEAWNIYTISRHHLGPVVEQHPEVAAAILARGKTDITALPGGHFHAFFYALEIEVGLFFSQVKRGILIYLKDYLPQLKKFGVASDYYDTNEEVAWAVAKAGVIRIHSDVHTDRGDDGLESSLPQRRAAADRDSRAANVVLTSYNGVEELDTILYTITACEYASDETLFVSGELLSNACTISEIMAWWETPHTTRAAASETLTPDGRFFEVAFTDLTSEMHQTGTLVVLFAGTSIQDPDKT